MRKKAGAKKRGGDVQVLTLDTVCAEEQYRMEPASELTPERLFDRRWALIVLEQAVARLRQEYAAGGGAELFEALRMFQTGEEAPQSYKEVAARLGITEGAVKSAIYRMRQRHGQLLREEIARTVATPAEIHEEIRYLIGILGG